MKRIFLAAILALAALSASAQTLVVYYSRTGQNYTSDGIVDLEVGNTAVVAQQIQKLTGADIFQLETVRQYAADYYECTQQAKEELNAKARPALKAAIPSATVKEGLSIQGSKVKTSGEQIEEFVKGRN